MLLDVNLLHRVCFIGKLNDIWLPVRSIVPEPVYENGKISVSYIAK